MARIPSLQTLHALESFARHGLVRDVAQELNLTRSAVSHQLRMLEREVDFDVFKRVGTRIELTARGRAYARDVSRALAALQGSAARHAGQELSGQLTVSCTPGFAATWLSSKIGRFRAICPEVALSIVTPKTLDDLSSRDADLFIAFGELPGGAEAELLMEVSFTPLVSPVLLNRLGGLQEPADVGRADLLHLADRGDWTAWCHAAGLAAEVPQGGVVFADMNLVYAAAMHAQGIAMGDEFICHAAMAGGQLVRPFDLAIRSPKSYYLVTPEAKREIASVTAFRQWVLGELGQHAQKG